MEKISLANLPAFAHNVLESLSKAPTKTSATIVALRGDLGAGKTTFTQALARELGIVLSLQSPTYVLMKKYPTAHTLFTTLVHIDAYRLENPKEFAALKPEEFLSDPHSLVVIEWPEKAGGILQNADIAIRFSSEGAGEEERYIEVV